MQRAWILVLTGLAFKIVQSDQGKCRSRFGNFPPDEFKLHACAWCYQFITQSADIIVHPSLHSLVIRNNNTIFPQWTIMIADVDNSTYSDQVCRTVTTGTCLMWKRCCQKAEECCQVHNQAEPNPNGYCPRTWDGLRCWQATPPETTSYIGCPSYLRFSVSSRYAEKTCTSKGAWFRLGNNSNHEWTDYRKCLDKESFLVSIYLGLACNLASIVLLIPATSIFLLYRSLRRQHRIRLHINFFGALVFANIVDVLWDMVVTHDRLTTAGSGVSVLLQNGGGCKFLAFLRLYSRSTTYVWMFCEGFYLHRLISNAFKPPKSLVFLYTIGWGAPLIYTSLYGILRIIYANESCWAKSVGQFQWILYAPNLFCLMVNFIFLANILRILLTRLQSHPNEPSNFRRALKATFVLIPLFGVQLFVTVYRLPAGAGTTAYEKFTVFVTNSQGFFVALIFCFFNGEVASHIKRTCTRLRLMRAPAEGSRAHTTATSVNFIQHAQESNESENGGLMYHSPRTSPVISQKDYNTMELHDGKYPYIPLATRKQSPSPTEM